LGAKIAKGEGLSYQQKDEKREYGIYLNYPSSANFLNIEW
jgi:hypothetical protein